MVLMNPRLSRGIIGDTDVPQQISNALVSPMVPNFYFLTGESFNEKMRVPPIHGDPIFLAGSSSSVSDIAMMSMGMEF